MNNQELGARIAQYRKAVPMTQEQLAGALGITPQAVSKWETGLSLPDILLLPRLAELFETSIDALFGIEKPEPVELERVVESLPWGDDPRTLHAVLYAGHRLIGEREISENSEAKRITFEYEGPALNVCSAFSVACEDVDGEVNAGGSVTCDDVNGSVCAGGNITCDVIDGDAQAGGNITCDEICGDAAAGCSIHSDEIGGDASGASFSFHTDDGKRFEKTVRFGDDFAAEIKKTVSEALRKVSEAFGEK